MAGPPNWVGQTFVQICDTLKWADIFIGKSIPQGDYYVEICDSLGGGSVLASGETTAVAGEYEFVRVRLSTAPGAEMFKGVKYMMKVRHQGSPNCSLNFYYHDSLTTGVNAYPWGKMYVGGTSYQSRDLAARVEGRSLRDGNCSLS